MNDKLNFNNIPVFSLGFRVFFLSASIYAVFSIFYWLAAYQGYTEPYLEGLTLFQWHAHEMVYGYSLAVIIGFLSAAVIKWTGKHTVSGFGLCLLWLAWLVARVLFLLGYMKLAGVFDALFLLCSIVIISIPIIKVSQWKRQSIVLCVLSLLLIGNIAFYIGMQLAPPEKNAYINIGIYLGFYLVIGMILLVGRRVVPFFIQNGVGYPVILRTSLKLDITIVVVFAMFVLASLLRLNEIVSYLALALFFCNSIRLIGWYTKGIWKQSLLWSLYLSLWMISLGFLLIFLSSITNISVYIAYHALSYGGLGMITLSMMARVSLGHTNRNVMRPPKIVSVILAIFFIGTIVRVIFPIIFSDFYNTWVVVSQVLWILSFFIFVYKYTPIWLQKNA